MNVDLFLDDSTRRRLRRHRLWYLVALVLFLLSLVVQQRLLLLAALLTLAIGLVPEWWYRHALRYLVVRQQVQPKRLFCGEEAIFSVTIENQKWFPLPWLTCEVLVRPILPVFRQQYSQQETIGLIDNSGALWPFQRVTRRYHLRCAARGLYRLGPLTLRCSDPFGWMERQAALPFLDTLLVYPLIVPIEALGLPPSFLFGEGVTPHRLFEDPLRVVGIRDYRLDDEPRRIHWKATARTGALRSKVYEYRNQRRLLLLLDTGDEATALMKISREMQEFAIAVAASLAVSALDKGYMVGALMNCAWQPLLEPANASQAMQRDDKNVRQESLKAREIAPPGIHIPFACDRGHYQRLLTTFTQLIPAVSTSMEQVIARERAMFSPDTLVILVSAVRKLAPAMVEWLLYVHKRGSYLRVVLMGEPEGKSLAEIHSIPIHYLGGGEQWHALVRSFAQEKNQVGGAKTVQLRLD